MNAREAFDPKTPLSQSTMDALGYLDRKDALIKRYEEALDTIARAGERVPDWRAMADIAKEALALGGDC